MANSLTQPEILNRLRNTKGHIAGIERMVEEGSDCSDILIQLAAVRAAIEKIGVFILENNAMECLMQGVDVQQVDKEKVERVVKQILAFLK